MEQKLRNLIKEAMQKKMTEKSMESSVRYQTLKNILETAQKIAKEQKSEQVTDEMILSAAKKEIKQLKDIEGFCEKDVERQKQIAIGLKTAQELLPKMATEEEIKDFILQNKTDNCNIGIMMKLLKEHFGGSLDGKMASQVVKSCI